MSNLSDFFNVSVDRWPWIRISNMAQRGIQLDVMAAEGLRAMFYGKCINGIHLYEWHGQMGAQCCLAAKRSCGEAVALLSSLSFL